MTDTRAKLRRAERLLAEVAQALADGAVFADERRAYFEVSEALSLVDRAAGRLAPQDPEEGEQ